MPAEPESPRPDVRRMEAADRGVALATVLDAFAADPLLRWVWPEEERYVTGATAMFGLLLDLRRAGGEVWIADGGAAVAMWDPPGGLYVKPLDDPWPALHATFRASERERWQVFDSALAVPADAGPHWYLGVLATTSARQGRGLGTAVLEPVLTAADRTGTATYLETMSEDNLRFYARVGFGVAREVDLPDAGPRCWLLRRDPQPRPGGGDGGG